MYAIWEEVPDGSLDWKYGEELLRFPWSAQVEGWDYTDSVFIGDELIYIWNRRE